MIQLGKTNTLTVTRSVSMGMFLNDGDEEVLLPNRYVPKDIQLGEQIDVFIYNDSEDRPIATTLSPKIQLDECATLKVKEVTGIGAFLDWGLPKDLFLPFREQGRLVKAGQKALVCLRLDHETNRLFATTKIPKLLTGAEDLSEGQEVKLIIHQESDLGWQVIINKSILGLLYHDEIFQPVRYGAELTGYIKRIREDGKVDVSLQKQGYAQVEDSQQIVLDKLKAGDGFLPITDKSSPVLIMSKMQMSKKVFKKAIGALYKERRITIETDGIRLTD